MRYISIKDNSSPWFHVKCHAVKTLVYVTRTRIGRDFAEIRSYLTDSDVSP